jgi:peptidoglycan/xylan/chitin deacetylase (PgdA/CDA1 family)
MKGYEPQYGYLPRHKAKVEPHNKTNPIFKSIPVLMYHCVDRNVWGAPNLFVAPKEFQKQMEYLKNNGYTAITFRDLDHVDKIPKPVIITFDDGYKDNYTYAFPVLKKYNMKATIFVILNSLGKSKSLNMEEMNRMKGTIDFQSHTMSHPHLGKLGQNRVEYEVSESKRKLEKLTGKDVFVIAYPYGSYDKQTIDIVKKYYKYAVTVKLGFFQDEQGYNNYQIDRIAVTSKSTLSSFIRSIKVQTSLKSIFTAFGTEYISKAA